MKIGIQNRKLISKLKNDFKEKYEILKVMDDDILAKMVFYHPTILRLSNQGMAIFSDTYPHQTFKCEFPLMGMHKLNLSRYMTTPYFIAENKTNKNFSLTIFDEQLIVMFSILNDGIEDYIKNISEWNYVQK